MVDHGRELAGSDVILLDSGEILGIVLETGLGGGVGFLCVDRVSKIFLANLTSPLEIETSITGLVWNFLISEEA